MKHLKSFYLYLSVLAALGATARLHADDTVPTNSTQAILHHPGFREGLVWLGPSEPSEAESEGLWRVIKTVDKPNWMTAVEQFLESNPASPWAASLHYDYACFCHRTGRTTKALAHWQVAWALVKNDASPKARRLGGAIIAAWADQLSSLGRRDKLKELIAIGANLPFVNPKDQEAYQGAKRNYFFMGSHPEMSFRCGTLALKAIGQEMQPTNHSLESLVEMPSPTNGFSMALLADLATQHGLDLAPVHRARGQDLIVPSVVHWRQNHYAAILQQKNDEYLVNDPTFGRQKWIPKDVINEETDGIFLIPAASLSSNWAALDPSEAATIHGMGLPLNLNDNKDKGCTRDFSGSTTCPQCHGMPVWWVSEPYLNLWIADEPLSYMTSRGEPFSFRISYKQRGDNAALVYGVPEYLTNTYNPWAPGWLSYITITQTAPSAAITLNNSDTTLLLPNGGEADFPAGQPYDPENRLLLQQTYPAGSINSGSLPYDDGLDGLRVVHADGSEDIYGQGAGHDTLYGDYQFYTFLLTRHIDVNGGTTFFYYGGSWTTLLYVVDCDGRTNTLSYSANTNGAGGIVLSQVTNPYGQSAYFYYDHLANLTNITDAAGLSTGITYDSNAVPTKLITPYGTNTFTLIENELPGEGNIGGDNLIDRAAEILDPTGATNLFMFRYDCSEFMGTNYTPNTVPTNTPLGTLDAGTGGTNLLCGVDYRNSFYWNSRQCAALSTSNITNLTSSDFLLARMKHWLQDSNDVTMSEYLSVERDPSPDGATEGLKTFYDYQGKTYPHRAGTNSLPSVRAWCLPGQETHYEYILFDYFGNITNSITTYTMPSGTWGARTNQFLYAANTYTNIFYAQYLDSSNNPFYLPFQTNTFTVPNLLTQVIDANSSNIWTLGNFDVVSLTNYFYEAGSLNQIVLSSLRLLPDRATNGLGQTTSFSFTNLNKITGIQRPDGLTTTNLFDTNGFLIQTVDIQTQRTNSFAYSNGLPSIHTNELGLVTGIFWDNLLRLTGVSYPDGTSISNTYSRLDLIARKDRLTNWTYFGYDGDKHLTSITNANNAVTYLGWCGCGTLTSITDALTNTTTLNYDFQSRLTNVLFPDASSLTYQYDLAGRKTNVADGSGKSIQMAYNNQGTVTNITNSAGALSQVLFDILDRPTKITDANNVTVTNIYDMLDRIVARVWTADGTGESFLYATNGLIAYTNRNSQVTRYGRDAAERLLALTNANMQVIQFGYDPASHLTNLIDGLIHSTRWNYNQYGWLTNKVDATNRPIYLYSYDADGRLTNRFMLASGNTGFAYDSIGNLTNIVYSNSPTRSISYAYDALNRLTNMIDGVGTTAFGYTKMGQLASESNPFSSLNGAISFLYSQGYRTNLSLTQPTGDWTQTYSYDNAWRLTGLSSSAGSFTYNYASSASALVQSLSLPNGAYITYQYDSLARLTNSSLANYWGHVLDGYGYGYDYLGQRTAITRSLGLTTNKITASYDNIGQIVSWEGAESGGAARMNEQLGYGYDAANNLHLRTNGGLTQTFSVDTLNQIFTVTRTAALTFTGATPAPATNVMVNGQTAQTYGDLTFARTNITLADGANLFTNIALNDYSVAFTNVITANLPATVTMQYDTNGNLTNDGTRSFIYDAENELTNVNVAGQWKTEFVFDGLRRKRITRDYTWQSGNWLKTNETRYIYDWMLIIQARDTNNNPLVTYTRGLDLSGTLQGAGGIGGLLLRTDTNGSAFYHSDGSGNITALIDEFQNIVARYEYDAYGKLIGKWGALADANTYRFSSKEFQPNSGLYCYNYRFYEPNFQRWLSHDPIEEAGGFNLYYFVGNNPVSFADSFGLWWTWTYNWMPMSMVRWFNNAPAEPETKSAPADSNLSLLNQELGSGSYDATQLHSAANLLQDAAELNPVVGVYNDVYGVSQSKDAVTYDNLSRGDQIQKAADAAATLLPFGKLAKSCEKTAKKTSKIDRAAFRAEREAFWKAEAKDNPTKYGAEDLSRMEQGKAPTGTDGFPVELHHVDGTPEGGVTPMTRTDHRLGDNYKINHP